MKRLLVVVSILLLLVSNSFANANMCDFENFDLEDDQHLESDIQQNFVCNDVTFSYKGTTGDYGFYWNGFSYSTHRDTYTKGYLNQYSAITKYGVDKSDTYVIAYPNSSDFITLPQETNLTGFYITNTTYAYISMNEGDSFAKKFGGETGNDEDFFKLTISGYDKNNAKTGEVDFYLADYRFSDNLKDYIVNKWKWVDLSSLGNVKTLKFAMSSSDNGDSGMNTPAYFAIDNFNGEGPEFNGEGPEFNGEGPEDDDNVITCFIDLTSKSSNNLATLLACGVFGLLVILSSRREQDDK